MRYYYREGQWIHVGFEYRPHLVATIKSLGARYNASTKEWYMQMDLETSSRLKGFLEENGFREDRKVLPREVALKQIDKVATKEEIKEMFDILELNLNLRDYQIEGVTYMINHGNCINGCSCGLGKSRTTIAYAELLDTFPCIVICPSTVKSSWEKEWKLCNPKRTLHVIDSSDGEDTDWKADVTIINYDYLFKRGSDKLKLRYSRSLSKKWQLVVLDEIHLCKNEKALRSKAVQKITEKAVRIVALSGTVIMNRPKELVNVLTILKQFNKIFPSVIYYLYRYCNAKKTRFGLDCSGASNTMELNEIIRHYCYFRKEKREVLKELPSIITQQINCPITNKKVYDKAEADLIEWLEKIDLEKAERAERAEHLVRLIYLKELSILGKLKFIESYLKEWQEIDEHNKVIVFGIRTAPLKELHSKIKNSVLVIGEMSLEDKMKKVEEFKKDKQILFANLATLSTGIDGLQNHCNDMIFLELPPRPSDLEQAISRIERMGQKNSINVYYLLSEETIDMQIKEVLEEKTKVTNAVVKGQNVFIDTDDEVDVALMKKLKKSRNH